MTGSSLRRTPFLDSLSCFYAALTCSCSANRSAKWTTFSDDGSQDADSIHTSLNMPSRSIPTAASGLSDSASRSHSMSHQCRMYPGLSCMVSTLLQVCPVCIFRNINATLPSGLKNGFGPRLRSYRLLTKPKFTAISCRGRRRFMRPSSLFSNVIRKRS